ncbi:ATP-binding protein [Streptomyces sp. NBC_01262]|uniref:ATP-binding protein n=1 Tax=Streptomyces sp. NBC_01262 TaxID=2903803 RepID=UPI002E2FD954|nr:ATP-binding protein [Streptomyces sp. NBC_01262]
MAHGPRAPREARRIARGVLEEAWRVGGETVDAMLLVVSELVTNAVEHARPHLSLRLHREHADRRIWISLTDGGPAAREGAWTASCAADEHGRGMAVIAALSAAHGTSTHPDGRATHWACLRTPA